MAIVSTVRERMGGLRLPGHPIAPRAVTVSRVIDAPVGVVRECCWDAARHGIVHAVGISRLSPELVRASVAVGPVRHEFRAAVASGPGILRWRGAASSGTVRLIPLGDRRTRVDVTLTWTPRAVWAHAAAATDLDRREITAALHRIAVIAESEAADAALGPFVV